MVQFNFLILSDFLNLFNLNEAFAEDETQLSISLGIIKGSFIKSRLGKQIYSYRGIRYAESPIRDLRFKQAVPVKPWKNIFDASVEGTACPQPNINFISEDCLRLNIYTTDLPSKNKRVKKPVIVFFHPGGFYARSSQSIYHGPQYLLDKNLVLVTVNYRLASLGFISASMSGSPVKPEPLPSHQKDLAEKQARVLNCPTDTIENMIKCMKTKPVEEFANSLFQFNEWYGDPILRWRPVVEPEFSGVERFLTENPSDLIRKGKFEHVPFFGGVTKDKFAGVIKATIERARNGNTSSIDDRNANWDYVSPISFLYERNTSRSKYISHELKKFYLNDQPISLDNILGLGKIYADAVTIFSEHRLVTLLAAANKKPTYYYKLSFQGRCSHVTWADTKKPFGVVHHDDLIYLFGIKQFPEIKEGDPELPTVERMTAIWEHFAKTGEPIPKDNPLFKNVTWNPITKQHTRYLEINTNLTMRNGIIYPARMHLWERLFPLRSLSSCKNKGD